MTRSDSGETERKEKHQNFINKNCSNKLSDIIFDCCYVYIFFQIQKLFEKNLAVGDVFDNFIVSKDISIANK